MLRKVGIDEELHAADTVRPLPDYGRRNCRPTECVGKNVCRPLAVVESTVLKVAERSFPGCGFVDRKDLLVILFETDDENIVGTAGVESDAVNWPLGESFLDILAAQPGNRVGLNHRDGTTSIIVVL